MRILITNLFLGGYSGTETVAELLADGLRRAGHAPMLLAPSLGPQADRLRTRGHMVVDRIAALPARPDVIHAQHTPVALSALAAFPDVPMVFSCHSAQYEVEAPRLHPQIRRWIAVDDLCRDRCISRGVPADRLSVILNAVDLDRFGRRTALPGRPQRALLLTKNHGHQSLVRAACIEQGIALDELGPATDRVSDRIEDELPAYDLVFATARMALEAAAVGAAVVVCDARGFAGLLTRARLPVWRRLNFGAGLLVAPATLAGVREAIAGYDPADAAEVTDTLRAEASLDNFIAGHLAVYEAARSEPAPAEPTGRAMATAAWIEDMVPSETSRDWRVIAHEMFSIQAEPLSVRLQAMEDRLHAEITRHSTDANAVAREEPRAPSYDGSLDGIFGTMLSGWCRRRRSSERVFLRVQLNGRDAGRVLAASFRADLLTHGIGDGWHAFTIDLDTLQLSLDNDTIVRVLTDDGLFVLPGSDRTSLGLRSIDLDGIGASHD